MRWTPGKRRDDLEDRRGMSGGGAMQGLGAGRIGLGEIVVLLILSVVFKRANAPSVRTELQADCLAGGYQSGRPDACDTFKGIS